jgi:hypothetical protein
LIRLGGFRWGRVLVSRNYDQLVFGLLMIFDQIHKRFKLAIQRLNIRRIGPDLPPIIGWIVFNADFPPFNWHA